ncbi:PDZ domain-containing protein 2 [Oreochromis niloticus]|uniref:PDZ domain-containing protein 2 n=1 Tax=Oreochromis niloticus TaxID=8128 RepID=A0A669F8L1_ORENI|nr:PDZ domain-containing protein 2 [Oreochromis niloticus]XP_005472734.1 PDZ domain-containing protein 2 [Oreochromis niloticus]
MDSSLLPASQNKYGKQRTGVKFTVRSANSPTYSLSRRSGVRKREGTGEVAERERYRTHTNTNGTNKDDDTVTGYETRTRSGSGVSTNRTIPEFGTDRRENPAFESRGRSAWRGSNLTSRSKSLDFKTGARTPDPNTIADFSQLSNNSKGDTSKYAGALEGRRTRIEGSVMDRISLLQAFNSVGITHVQERSELLERGSRGNTLPTRLRSLSGSSSRNTDTSSSLGPKSGQSIMERIEKLFGPTGFGKTDDYKNRDSSNNSEASTDSLISQQQKPHEKTAGGTFPRSFFAKDSDSAVKSGLSLWTQKDANASGFETSFSSGASISRDSSPGGRMQGRYSEEGGVHWGKGFVETGTRSLDRARSRSSVAAQIRSARANAQPTTLLEETPVSFRESSGFRDKSKDESSANHREEKSETNEINGMLTDRTRSVDGPDQITELKGGNTYEDVFETNPQKTNVKTTERQKALSVSSAASVRNKINQYEALTQRAQGFATGQVQIPRRTFSVPAQVSRGHEGVKKSGSAKEISELRKKWAGLQEGGEAHGKGEDKMMGTVKKVWPDRNVSVDETGLRIEKEQKGLNDLDQKRKTDSTDDLKISGLKTTQEMPHESDRAVSGKLGTEETDFSKASSPEEASERDVTGNSTPTPLPPCEPSHQERSHSDITSPVSDDEHTPTNSPSYLPTTSPMAQLGDVTPTADTDNKSPPVFTCPAKDPDSSPRTLPASSDSNLQDLISPDIQTAPQKGKKRLLDLNAWIAGLNPDLKVFSDDEDVDDDESTQKDDDSNYDSDSGESSVTITSNMSQSDRRSFSVTLSDLCNFAGADYDSENDSDDWQSTSRRTASMSSDMSAFSYVSVMPTEELDKLVEEVRNLGDDALQDYDDVQVVVLHKEVGVGLGFSLAGGVDQNKPITVHKVFHSGVAAKQGSIKEGDQVLSINGTALSGSAHWEALRVLRRAKAKDMVVVVVRRGDVIDTSKKGEEGTSRGQTPEQYETGQTVSVQLQKNSRDLGFSLEGGEGSSLGNRPLTVQKIFQGGPVDVVYPGDEVLEVQGTSVVGMRRLEAWTLIRALPPGPVDVVLRRSHKHPET